MSKTYSLYLKGIAILLMVFLHLFNNLNNDLALGYCLSIKNVPLIFYISRMCNPVPFFLILSGYGLYSVYKKMGEVKPKKRVLNLYIHLWIIYFLLLPLAIYINPNLFPGNWEIFIKNITSWQCSYIGEQWFFLPYIILMVFSKWVFFLFDKINGKFIFAFTIIIYGGTLLVLKIFGESFLGQYMLFYNPFLSFYMLFPFTLGYLAKRFNWVEWLKLAVRNIEYRNWLVGSGLFLLCVIRCCIPFAFIDPFYSIIFVLLFVHLPVNNILGMIFSLLGKHSMNIWLIHTWFSSRLFHDFIYDQVNYPFIMYIGVLLVSLLVSYIVEMIYKIPERYLVRHDKIKMGIESNDMAEKTLLRDEEAS